MDNFGNVIILILSTNNKSYNIFKSSQKETWIDKMEKAGVRCFFYEGDANECIIEGDTIKVNAPDDLRNCSEKFIKTLDIIRTNFPDVSLVYRTNLSSYIDVDNFLLYVSSIRNKKQFYAGKKCTFNIIHANYFRVNCKIDSLGWKLKSKMIRNGYFTINRFLESMIRNICLKMLKRFNVEFASEIGRAHV